MSTLNGHQHGAAVGEQLPMFLPAHVVVDHFHKIDSPVEGTPREQWEQPMEFQSPKGSVWSGESLRDVKLNGIRLRKGMGMLRDDGDYDLEKGYEEKNLPPVEVGRARRGLSITDGHHRLALHEQRSPNAEVPIRWRS